MSAVPDVDDFRGRGDAVRRLLVGAVERSTSPEDVAVALRVLGAVVDALEVDVERLAREIPSDGLGNPLPSGEAERRLWSSAWGQLKELQGALQDLASAELATRARV